MSYVIKLQGTVHDVSTPLDHQYLVEYDPSIFEENVIASHIVVSGDISEAKQFPDFREAVAYYLQERPADVLPPSLAFAIKHEMAGKPDRPLSAFTVEFETVWK